MGKLPFEERMENRSLLVKQENELSEKSVDHKDVSEKREVEELLEKGIVNVDKPPGPTSHQISSFVQEILGIEKSGHTGTLDPKVTGILPVVLNKGTKIVEALLNTGKEYVALMHLHKNIDQARLKRVIEEEFVGVIEQLPPIKSAVKREVREREIYYIEVLEKKQKDLLFKVGCEAGTYIRKLCHDIGESLGSGAHMTDLRRTKVSLFHEETSVTLQDLKDAYHYYTNGDEKRLKELILPVEEGIKHLPKIWVSDSTLKSLSNGVSLKIPGVTQLETPFEREEKVAVLTKKGELVMIGEAKMTAQEVINKERGVAAKPRQVFIRPEDFD